MRLLERTTRSRSLTEVGREFFERAVGLLGATEDARRAVPQAQGEPRGTLHLTCGVEFGLLAVNGWVRDGEQQTVDPVARPRVNNNFAVRDAAVDASARHRTPKVRAFIDLASRPIVGAHAQWLAPSRTDVV